MQKMIIWKTCVLAGGGKGNTFAAWLRCQQLPNHCSAEAPQSEADIALMLDFLAAASRGIVR